MGALSHRFDVRTFVREWRRNGRAAKAWGTIADLAPGSLEAPSPRNGAGTQQAVQATELGML